MVEAKVIAEQLGHVGRYHGVVDEVNILLPPIEQGNEPVGAHIGWTLIGDMLVEHAIESGDLLLGQCIRHGKVALQVEQVSFLIVHR